MRIMLVDVSLLQNRLEVIIVGLCLRKVLMHPFETHLIECFRIQFRTRFKDGEPCCRKLLGLPVYLPRLFNSSACMCLPCLPIH
jgi:hypothetical protein